MSANRELLEMRRSVDALRRELAEFDERECTNENAISRLARELSELRERVATLDSAGGSSSTPPTVSRQCECKTGGRSCHRQVTGDGVLCGTCWDRGCGSLAAKRLVDERDELRDKLAAAERERDEYNIQAGLIANQRADLLKRLDAAATRTDRAVQVERERCMEWINRWVDIPELEDGELFEGIQSGRPAPTTNETKEKRP